MDAASAEGTIGEENKFYGNQVLLGFFYELQVHINAPFVLHYYGKVPRLWRRGEAVGST